jgi:glucosamine--fructose-6-phosphate aminotransferase (isomerizing)
MCGIVGYIGKKSCIELLFQGLIRLEYRGYDSAGIAVLDGNQVRVAKSEGKLEKLRPRLTDLPQQATRGIGHTRWATHGVPNTVNAHPHVEGNVALVHNGIIENYEELRAELSSQGALFHSQTDTEVALQLFVRELRKHRSALAAIKAMLPQLKGAYSLGILVGDEADSVYVVKQGSPLVIGQGRGENFFASDAMALVSHTSRAHFLKDGEMAKITENKVEIWTFDGQPITPHFQELDISSASVEKLGFKHFMLKEIHEQPRVMSSMIKRFVDLEAKKLNVSEMGLSGLDVGKITNIAMVGCGTAHYSAQVGRYLLEPLTGLPVNVELASEFRYRKPWLDKGTLVIAVSQSGETADTLACVKHAKEQGCQILSVCNVKMSSIVRESHAALLMDAGPEIGVASTKAFTAMIMAHHLIALAIGQMKGRVALSDLSRVCEDLRALPALVDHAVDSKGLLEEVACKYYEATNFIFMGRGLSYPIALEGALKLKEISYIHAEGYAGGELKHGPIALIDRHMPVVALAPRDGHYEKMVSNIEEVKARQGIIIAIGAPDDERLKRLADTYIPCPELANEGLQSVLSVVPLQLLAYYVAVRRGTDVDQPRNLAKSVTVE